MEDLYCYERELIQKGIKVIAGVDEVGRGPLVGNVVAACVVLPLNYQLEGLTDSKKLSAKKREQFYDILMKDALAIGIGEISPKVIDEVNIYQATKLAMKEAIEKANEQLKLEYILIDAMPLELEIPTTSIIKGDSKSLSIAAASVIAKVTRDRELCELDKKYPMYDFAHPIEDAVEGITHSICTLEFEDHRPLYDWVVIETGYKTSPEENPKQIEFAKLYLTNVVTGKRYIKKLVEDGIVDGWDDPRLVSIAALRRRGFTPEAIKMFVELVGVTKAQGSVEYPMLEYCIREDLKLKVKRMMAVLDPVKLVIDNYPEGQVEYMEVANNQENPEMGTRKVPFTKELYIEREDFMEEPPKKYFRLFPGNEVRLMNAYFVTCTDYVKDENGKVIEVHCTYDPETRGGNFTGRKVKGTIHWVSATEGCKAEVRLYENIVDEEKGVYNEEDGSMNINPNSKIVLTECYLEPELMKAVSEDKFQFVRNGYFCVDNKDSEQGKPIFNRIVSLKSSFKLQK